MNIMEVVNSLEQASKFKYFKFILDKTTTSCASCRAHEEKRYREDEMPSLPIHPNCKCRLLLITDPVELARAKYTPRILHFVKSDDFNKERKDKEERFGKKIDGSSFSAPGKELAPNIEAKGFKQAMYEHIAFREGKHPRAYLDGTNLPTIGIGANMTQEHVIQKLVEMNVLSPSQVEALRRYRRLSDAQRTVAEQDAIKKILSNIVLTEAQIQSLFQLTYKTAESGAQATFSQGAWVKMTTQDGQVIMVWNESKVDKEAWNKLPDLVKAICIDIVFNAGSTGLSRYGNFLKAIKAGDYRRAAIELVDSKDATNKQNPGLMKRRMDAAIELTKLADEVEAKRKSVNSKSP